MHSVQERCGAALARGLLPGVPELEVGRVAVLVEPLGPSPH